MRAFPLLAVLALFVTTLPVRADPGGGDAPDEWEDARDIGFGTHTGTTTQGKPSHADYDWYRVVPPAGKGVRVMVHGGPVDASLRLTHDSSLTFQVYQPLRPVAGEPANFSASGILSDPAGVRIGLVISSPTWDYTMHVEIVDVVDIQLSGLEVREEPGANCFLHPLPCPVSRLHVSVEIRAIGALPYEGNLTIRALGAFWLTSADVERVALRVEPGSAFRVGLTWTPVAAGDFTLFVLAGGDANMQDNVLETRRSWLVSGTPGVVVA